MKEWWELNQSPVSCQLQTPGYVPKNKKLVGFDWTKSFTLIRNYRDQRRKSTHPHAISHTIGTFHGPDYTFIIFEYGHLTSRRIMLRKGLHRIMMAMKKGLLFAVSNCSAPWNDPYLSNSRRPKTRYASRVLLFGRRLTVTFLNSNPANQ